jgi:tetratricopeptide (TPR) repeat protein
VTLLTDERFIKKRIQQLSGNIDQASKYHIEDVIHLVRSFSPRRCHRGLEIEEGAFTTCNTANASSCSNSKNETVDLKETAVNIYHKFIVIVMASLNVTDDNSTTAGNIIVGSSDYGRCQHQFEEEEKNAVIARLFYLMGQSLSNDFGWKEESMQLYNMYILNVILNDDDEENNETNAVTARKTKIFRAMGDIHLEQENWEEALSAYNYAQSLIETKVEKQPWQTCHLVLDLLMSSIQLRIGNLYCKQGFLSDALCAYNKARDLQLSCQAKQIELQDDESRTSLILRQLSYTLHNIGVVRRHMDDLDGALDAFLTSISTLEEAAEQISTLEDELRKANTFNNMAGVLRRLERFGEAFLLYKETLRIKKQYLSESHPSISLTLAAMASTLRAGGQEQRAMKYYKAALK